MDCPIYKKKGQCKTPLRLQTLENSRTGEEFNEHLAQTYRQIKKEQSGGRNCSY